MSQKIQGQKLIHYKYGKPEEVVNLENDTLDDPGHGEVLLQMLASPVNPVDINMIEGKYLIKPPLPAIPGGEGVARVLKIGPGVKNIIVGDHVIPVNFIGTWRTNLIALEDTLLKVPTNLGVTDAATLTINPPTAYNILKDYVDLKPGDTVIQNAANSACGQLIIQLCHKWGFKTVNVLRDRPDIDALKLYLKDLGATYVLTEDEIQKTDIFENGELKKPLLALNCVGGQSATNLLRKLDFGGTLVTYGGMSREPVTASTSALVFRNLKLDGYNNNAWHWDEKNAVKKERMYIELWTMMLKGELKTPAHILIKFKDYKDALLNTLTPTGKVGKKYILDFAKVDSKI